MTTLNPQIAFLDMPARIRALPVDPARGYPVPWFVAWVDGKPEFRCADGAKFVRAVKEKLCWVCGDKLGTKLAFILGPMCAVNRISAEPPCHRECAEYSIKACPFLSRPAMERREGGEVYEQGTCAGVAIRRNPGVSILWMTKGYSLVEDGNGGVLFSVGAPFEIKPWAEGRTATTEEIAASFNSGLPILQKMAAQQGDFAEERLAVQVKAARKLLGIAA